ncbi:MAG: adenylyl-sulfate kinase [Vicinamibacterales bacterium]
MTDTVGTGGVCVWFTGLSGAGKSTTARMLASAVNALGRPVTLLDGDAVRALLSKDLGFSRLDRDANVARIAFVAREVVRHGGVVICAAVSPYRDARGRARETVGADRFIEVFVDTPLDVCEQRDTKGLYARARRGEIRSLTGVDDPYEPPVNPEVRLTTTAVTVQENVETVLALLRRRGVVA